MQPNNIYNSFYFYPIMNSNIDHFTTSKNVFTNQRSRTLYKPSMKSISKINNELHQGNLLNKINDCYDCRGDQPMPSHVNEHSKHFYFQTNWKKFEDDSISKRSKNMTIKETKNNIDSPKNSKRPANVFGSIDECIQSKNENLDFQKKFMNPINLMFNNLDKNHLEKQLKNKSRYFEINLLDYLQIKLHIYRV